MTLVFRDTIYALSSGRTPSGLAVIRLSGPHVSDVVAAMSGRTLEPRSLTLTHLRSADGAVLDHAMAVIFPAPRSFTGETCAEFHLHGGRAVVNAVLADLSRRPGLRHAEAGEFSRRALVNGKFSLTEAEALADLIDARTEAQRSLAVQNLGGGHSALYAGWRTALLHARAMLEAEIDFSDEDDVPDSAAARIWDDLGSLVQAIRSHLGAYRRAEIVRDGYRVAITGAPNAGKSSLINALARRDVAIVSDEPGTTRDLVEVELDLDGTKVVVTDTAGIRADPGAVEREGIKRARGAAGAANLVLWLTDATGTWDEVGVTADVPVLRVATKSDRVSHSPPGSDRLISSRTGEGISDLLEYLSAQARLASDVGEDLVPFAARHASELETAATALERCIAGSPAQLELRVEDLRVAGDALGRLVGTIGVEDILDVVFSRFCIGK